ncbi:hypothetical protein F5887DRAFT_1163193 [Amanita rubescens]|nr:hypothetical protein F5887DRAFT_1163193 [Amanita rubescens]
MPPPTPVAAIASLVPTTDRIAEECPRLRILIIGQSRTGKSSLINAIFRTSLADVKHDQAGYANIDEGIASPHNEYLTLHDSRGYEPGDIEKFGILERFITDRSQREPIAERLHAIWLCITAPFSGGRIFETGEENIFKLNRNKGAKCPQSLPNAVLTVTTVPIIVVFTKFDLFIASLSGRSRGEENISVDLAEKMFRDEHGPTFERATHNISGNIPYTAVARLDVDLPIALAAMQLKIATSTEAGERAIRSAIGSGIGFYGFKVQKCQYAIHKDIIMVWNIRDLDEHFLSDEFYNRMAVIVGDLSPVQNVKIRIYRLDDSELSFEVVTATLHSTLNAALLGVSSSGYGPRHGIACITIASRHVTMQDV